VSKRLTNDTNHLGSTSDEHGLLMAEFLSDWADDDGSDEFSNQSQTVHQ
jgi:hypothetical protein